MHLAVELADRGFPRTAPNPRVGAVLVKDGEVAARGWHERHGGPHAEVNVLEAAARAGIDPAGCDLYVTLEPCNHHGRTPPCTEAVLAAGVPRVVIGCQDPNTDVAGGGAARLARAGVEVHMDVAGDECRDLIDDFLVWKQQQRPYVFLKLAQTLDGRIAGTSGRPEPVSNPASLGLVHRLRGRVDAVLVGAGTLRADNPRLTPRGPDQAAAGGTARRPLAVVVATRLPGGDERRNLGLLATRPDETVFLTGRKAEASAEAEALRRLGCRVWGLEAAREGGLDLAAGLHRLHAELDCRYVLCEGGGGLAGSLARQALADELWLFIAPRVLGSEAAPASFSGAGPLDMAQALEYRWVQTSFVDHEHGCDLLAKLKPRRRPCSPD
jgi:diaminohydroxyphosphoribosylaminopyrimidine deaminase/5-amino-6-(5-phosphoribosylamino)uracil reductase